jgi:hypothetical protein
LSSSALCAQSSPLLPSGICTRRPLRQHSSILISRRRSTCASLEVERMGHFGWYNCSRASMS